MEQPPPQTGVPEHVVEVRPSDSPRTRRFRSDEPVVTANELHHAVDGYQRRNSDPPSSPRAGQEVHKPVPPVGAAPPPALTPRPPPTVARRRRRCLVRRACGCFTLQQGAYFIGVLQVTNGILSLLLEVMYLLGLARAGSYALDDDLTGNLPGDDKQWGSASIAYASLSGFLLLQELICLFFAGLLLHGARVGRPGYVRAWLLFTGIMLAVGIGTWAGRLTLEFMFKPFNGFILLIRCLIYLSLPVYFLVVVRSFYYELLELRDAAGEAGIPLMRSGGGGAGPAPPPYSEEDPAAAAAAAATQAPALPDKRPLLETSFDAHAPVTTGAGGEGGGGGAARADDRFDLSLSADHGDGEARGGSGGSGPPLARSSAQEGDASGHKARAASGASSASGASGAELRRVPRVVATVGRDGQVTPVRDSGVLEPPHHHPAPDASSGGGDAQRAARWALRQEEMDAVEIRPTSRRPIGAGRMVLPPLPPGHRESLQHVGLPDLSQPPPSATTSTPTSF